MFLINVVETQVDGVVLRDDAVAGPLHRRVRRGPVNGEEIRDVDRGAEAARGRRGREENLSNVRSERARTSLH